MNDNLNLYNVSVRVFAKDELDAKEKVIDDIQGFAGGVDFFIEKIELTEADQERWNKIIEKQWDK